MLRIFARLSTASVLLAALKVSAGAAPNCLSDQKPYALTDDVVHWSMTIVPGADCIQGLRWSYMQIEQVSISSAPKNGKAVIVGPGFRLFCRLGVSGIGPFHGGRDWKKPENSRKIHPPD